MQLFACGELHAGAGPLCTEKYVDNYNVSDNAVLSQYYCVQCETHKNNLVNTVGLFYRNMFILYVCTVHMFAVTVCTLLSYGI